MSPQIPPQPQIGQKRKALQVVEKVGSGARTRTGDLGIMRPSLCRLSYAAPEEADVKGSNQLTIPSSSRQPV